MGGQRMSLKLSKIEDVTRKVYKKPPLICIPLGDKFLEKLEGVIRKHINSKNFINEISTFKSRITPTA